MNRKLDLLLIHPGGKRRSYGSLTDSIAAIEPPLWAGLIAAWVRQKGLRVEIIDLEAQNLSDQEAIDEAIRLNPLLVAVGAIGANPSASSTPKMVPAGRFLRLLKARAPDTKSAIYGIHPSALPRETLTQEAVDFLFRGECFYAVVDLLRELIIRPQSKDYNIAGLWYKKDGNVVGNGWGKMVENLDDLPFVAWDLLPMQAYRAHNWHCFGQLDKRKPYAVIYTSLGCPYNCRFCNIKALYNGKPGIRFRSPKRVVDEIDYLVRNYGVRNIKFLDEIFVLKQDRVLEICDLLIPRKYNLNIWAYTRVDTIDIYALEQMRKAGVKWLAFGIESASSKVRQSMVKGRFQQEAIRKAIRLTKRAGINIVANFIFGLPSDDLETMRQTFDLARELNCEYTNFYTAMAYPGSELYEEIRQKSRDLPANWLSYAQFSEEARPLATEYLSSAQVLRFRDEAFHSYHSDPGYLNRIRERFGQETVEHITRMLEYKINRKFAQ